MIVGGVGTFILLLVSGVWFIKKRVKLVEPQKSIKEVPSEKSNPDPEQVGTEPSSIGGGL